MIGINPAKTAKLNLSNGIGRANLRNVTVRRNPCNVTARATRSWTKTVAEMAANWTGIAAIVTEEPKGNGRHRLAPVETAVVAGAGAGNVNHTIERGKKL